MDKNEYVKRWLWHAFNGLDSDGTVDPQQLKVLTAHVSASLGSNNKGNMSHKAGERYRYNSTLAVCFSNYLEFLEEQGFLNNDQVNVNKLEETTWSLSIKEYSKRDHKVVADLELKKLWQIFNFLAEPDSFPVVMDREEMMLLMEKLVIAMGMKWDPDHFEHVTTKLHQFTFNQMVVCFESAFAKGTDPECIEEAIMEVYDEIIEEVMKKGFLYKKGHKMKNWKERWFILKPGCLAYYTSRNEKEKKGDIRIRASWKTEILEDQKNYKNCFVLYTEDKHDKDKTKYELSGSEPKVRRAWIQALEAVIQREMSGGMGQYGELLKRRERRRKEREKEEEAKRLQEEAKRRKEAELREERRRQEAAAERAAKELALIKAKEEEERRQRQQEKEARERAEKDAEKITEALADTQKKLEDEERLRQAKEEEERLRREQDELDRERIAKEHDEIRRALDDASRRADMEAGLREEEQKHLAELEETLRKLQMLLEEEKRARLEEEQAKELQQRLLDEETKKRENLERLKEEQAQLLAEEQHKRENLEIKSEELTKEREMQMAVLEEERVRLAELEEQREAADKQLEIAMEKIAVTERHRAIIQKKREELSKIKSSVGLAQPLKPEPKRLFTHRGVTAAEVDVGFLQQLPQETDEQVRENGVKGQSTANGHL